MSDFFLARKLIALAGEQKGYVYGDFIINVIIPDFYDLIVHPEEQEFDLWFKTQWEFDNFVKKSSEIFTFDQYTVISSIGQQYKRENLKGKHITIKAVIYNKFPFNDVDFDKLLFSANESRYYRVDGLKQFDLLIQNIKNKIVTANIDYLTTDKSFEVIKRRFFDKGWIVKIKVEDVELPGGVSRVFGRGDKIVFITKTINYWIFYQETESERFKLLFNEGYFITQNEVINLESRPIDIVNIGADKIDNTPKDLTDKDIMLYIFDQGLVAINDQVGLTNEKLKYIYDNGQNKCRDDFQELINKS